MTKIMLVEDDKSLREIYGVRLLAEGYDIISAGDGEEALAMAIKDRPQLIISDVMMPKISGFDMLDILRSTTETKNIRVIMMTALSSDEQRQRGEQLGADKYLVKSQVGIEDVVKAVHEVLGDKPGDSNLPNPVAQPVATAAVNATPAYAQPVSTVATTSESTIPQPTAPFTGQRPQSLGNRVIQPLKDNPRVNNVDVGELIDKEFTANPQDLQNVENTPDPEAPEPVTAPVGTASKEPTPQSSPPPIKTVSMDPPSPAQPAADDADALQILNSQPPQSPAPANAQTAVSSVPSTTPTSIPVQSPDPDPVAPTDAAVPAPAPAPAQPAATDRSDQPLAAPDRTPPTIPSYE